MNPRISWLDVKLGVRMLLKYPAISIVGGLGIAVGVGVSVGFFSFLSANFLPDLPLPEGDRIVALENRDLEINNEERRSVHDFLRWREELRTIEHVGAFRTVSRNLSFGGDVPELVPVAEMTAAGFRVARVPPLIGRHLTEDDERVGAADVVVIGHDVWRNRLAADPRVIGRELRLGGRPHTIVGVMPEGFAFPENHEFWTPFRPDASAHPLREGPAIYIFGRLADGVTMAQAQAELAAVGQRTAAEFPETHSQIRPMVMPYTHSLMDIQGMTLWDVGQMQLMVTLLLVLIAVNVSLLVYARTVARRGEITVRSALGATRLRIVGQLFTEALVLSAVSAAAGLALARLALHIGNQIMLMEMDLGAPFWVDYGLQPMTVLFTVALALLAAAIVGAVPGLKVTRRDLQEDLRELGGATRMRLGRTWTLLVVAQVALSVAALPAAISLGWDTLEAASERPTYPAEEYAVASLAPEADLAPGEVPPPIGSQLTELVRRLREEPSVAGVTYRADLPRRENRITVEGMPAPPESPSGHRVASTGVAPDYFSLFGTRVLAGRGLEDADLAEGAPGVVVNEAFVQQVLGGGEALGRRIRHVGPEREEPAGEPRPWYQIVGVVENMTTAADPERIDPRISYPVRPADVSFAQVFVRLRGSTPAEFAPRLREVAAAVDPSLRLSPVRSLADSNRQERLAARLVGLAVGLVLLSVLLLTAGGVYALVSFTVTQRGKEIGIRTALGAPPRQLLRSVFSRVALQIGLGLGIGLIAAAVLENLTGGELIGGRGSVVLPALALTMAGVALLGALGPARRGLRIQPTQVLRADG